MNDSPVKNKSDSSNEKVEKSAELGVTLVEKGLIIALIAVICVGGKQLLGQKASYKYQIIGEAVDEAGPD